MNIGLKWSDYEYWWSTSVSVSKKSCNCYNILFTLKLHSKGLLRNTFSLSQIYFDYF